MTRKQRRASVGDPGLRRLRLPPDLTRAVPMLIRFVAASMSCATAAAGDLVHNGTRYATFTAAPADIELFWLDEAGVPLRQFRRVQQYLQTRSRAVRFLMNGGIFDPGGVPSGLLVIGGQTLRPLNTADAPGNFYLKPNGIFYLEKGQARIVATEDYIVSRPEPELAIQSGPLLLRAGKIHPAFRAGSTNYLHRNGAGILPDGMVLFAITEFGQARYPNLFEFADFFRAQGCADALFLDGDLSQMVAEPKGLLPVGNQFGAIFGVTAPSP